MQSRKFNCILLLPNRQIQPRTRDPLKLKFILFRDFSNGGVWTFFCIG